MAVVDRSAHSPARGPAAAHRQAAASSTTSRCPACCTPRSCAARIRMPRSAASTHATRARAAGVHAVLTLDDLAPVLAQRRMLRHSNSGTPLDRLWSFALADGEVSYVGEAVAIVVADDRYLAEDAAALVEVDYDVLPAVADCRKATRAGCARGPPRAQQQHRRHLQGRTTATPKRPSARPRTSSTRSSGSIAAARHPIEGRGILAEFRATDDSMTVWASTQKAHDLFQSLTALLGFDESRLRVATPGRRRRLRAQALRLSGGHRGGGGGQAAAALDQMDRGPARAFHQRRAGARPVLVARHRGRCRRQAARRPRPPDPRSRRLRAAGRQHSVQLRLDDERALHAARAVHGGHGRRHQQDAGVVGARRRLSAGRLRDGAADGPRRARAESRARRGAAAQSHPAGEDALHQAAQGALRRQHAIRQRRLSGLPGAGAAGGRLGRFPAAPGGGARAGPLSRHRARARHQGHRPRAVRVRAWCGCRTPGASRCSPAPPRSGRGSAPRSRRSAPASSACAPRTSPWCPATPAACRSGSAPSPAARP